MNENSFIKCEAVKTAYRQNKSGIVVSFLLHPSEFSSELAIAPIGTRVLLAVAEISDEIAAGNFPATPSLVDHVKLRHGNGAADGESGKREPDNFSKGE